MDVTTQGVNPVNASCQAQLVESYFWLFLAYIHTLHTIITSQWALTLVLILNYALYSLFECKQKRNLKEKVR